MNMTFSPTHNCIRNFLASAAATLFTLAWVLPVSGQSVEWIHRFPLEDAARPGLLGGADGITVDHQENIYITGDTLGALYADHLGDWDSSGDGFIAKFTADGEEVWGVQFGTHFHDTASDIALDADGNIYVVGSTKHGSLFGETGGHWDGYLAKYDTDGNKVWGFQFGDEDRDTARDVAVDSSNNVYVVGQLDVNTNRPDLGDGYLAKFDNDGNEIWRREFGTSFRNELLAINDRTDIALITSDYEKERSLIRQTLRRLDVDGTELWAVDGLEVVRAVALDDQGSTYVTGGLSTERFLSKYDDDGQLIWTHNGPESGGYNVFAQNGGGILVSGVDPREGTNHVFSSFDTNGKVLWTRSIDGLSGCCAGIAGDDSGNFYHLGGDERQDAKVRVLIKFNTQRLGDLERDEVLNVADVDALGALIQSATYSTITDFNWDDAVDAQDLAIWVTELKETHFGDADLNGTVDFADFLFLSAGFGSDGGWGKGDFDASGNVEFADFLILSNNFGKSGPAAASVPEPSSAFLALMCVSAFAIRGRKRV